MAWLFLAILGAFFDASYYAFVKRHLRDVNPHVLASGIFLSAFLILLIISLIHGIPRTGPAFYDSVLITGTLNVIAASLYFQALRSTDLSLSIPMISFTPAFLIMTSFVVLGEAPSAGGSAGIALIVVGSYVLNTSRDRGGLFEPFKSILKNRGILYMLAVALLYSLSANYDKRVVLNSDPIFGSSMIFLFIGGSFWVISRVRRAAKEKTFQKNILKFLPAGLMISMAAFTINIAFTMQIVPYVISIKRLSILFSVLYGRALFREKDIPRRILGSLIMIGGAALIVLS